MYGDARSTKVRVRYHDELHARCHAETGKDAGRVLELTWATIVLAVHHWVHWVHGVHGVAHGVHMNWAEVVFQQACK